MFLNLNLGSMPAGFDTKLSSAGLVYKHFGLEIVAGLMGKPASDASVETVYLAVYRQFMEAIDAIDNGASRTCTASRGGIQSRAGRWFVG